MRKLGLLDVFSPLYQPTFLLTSTIFYIKNGTTKISTFRCLQILILLTLEIIYTILHFDSFILKLGKDFAKANTVLILFCFRFFGNLLLVFVILILNYFNKNNWLRLLQQIQTIDNELGKFHYYDQVISANYTMWKWTIFLIIAYGIVWNIIGEFLVFWLFTPNFAITEVCAVLYPLNFGTNMKIYFYISAGVLKKRFEIINRLLREKIVESQRSERYPVDSARFNEFVRKIVNLHKTLVEIGYGINDIYSIKLLLTITMNFVLLVGDLHTSIYIIFFDLLAGYSRLMIVLLRRCCTYLFDFYYLVKQSMDLCNEANSTRLHLLSIRIDSDNEDVRNCLIASTLKLMQNKLTITAFKLFNIDNALLFSICAAVSSYLFIMLQLDIGNNDNKSKISINQTNITVN